MSTLNARDLIHGPSQSPQDGRIAIGLFDAHGLLFFAEPVVAGRRSVASTTQLWVYEADMARLIREIQPPELAPYICQGLPPQARPTVIMAHEPTKCTFNCVSAANPDFVYYWIPESDLIQGLKAIYDRPTPGSEALSPPLIQLQPEPSSRRSIDVATVECIKIERAELGVHPFKVHFKSLNTGDPSTFSTEDLSDLNAFKIGAYYKVSITAVD